jgi:hypothetical protein
MKPDAGLLGGRAMGQRLQRGTDMATPSAFGFFDQELTSLGAWRVLGDHVRLTEENYRLRSRMRGQEGRLPPGA